MINHLIVVALVLLIAMPVDPTLIMTIVCMLVCARIPGDMTTANLTWWMTATQFAADVADLGKSTALSVSLMLTKMNSATASATVCTVDQLALISLAYATQYVKVVVKAQVRVIAMNVLSMPQWLMILVYVTWIGNLTIVDFMLEYVIPNVLIAMALMTVIVSTVWNMPTSTPT